MDHLRSASLGILVATSCALAGQAAAASDNPAFLAKRRLGHAYRVDHHPGRNRSICGKNDLQPVNGYQTKLGRGMDFARLHKFAVGAMADTNTADSFKYCSGTLVGPDLYLTAGHCVDDTTVGQFIAFNFEYGAGTQTVQTQDFYKITAVAETGKDLDYAIVKLDGSPGLKWGWVDVRTRQADDQEVLTIIQHPNGEPKQIDVGHADGFDGDYVKYADLDTEPGSSGSGVLDANGELIAVHTLGGCTDTDGYNSAVRLNAVGSDTLVAKLAAKALPFKDGSTVRLTLAGVDGAGSLAADVAGHSVVISKELAGALTSWTVVDMHDGSFNLEASDAAGHKAYLDGRADSGQVTLRDSLDPGDFGAKWRIVVTDDGRYLLHTVGGTGAPQWLSTGTSQANAVGLSATGGAWQISAP